MACIGPALAKLNPCNNCLVITVASIEAHHVYIQAIWRVLPFKIASIKNERKNAMDSDRMEWFCLVALRMMIQLDCTTSF